MGAITEQEVHKALKVVTASCTDPYARAYAQTAIDMNMRGYELKVQVRYVMSNTQYWRGTIAKETKQILNNYLKN